jgi:hypothetical protein
MSEGKGDGPRAQPGGPAPQRFTSDTNGLAGRTTTAWPSRRHDVADVAISLRSRCDPIATASPLSARATANFRQTGAPPRFG